MTSHPCPPRCASVGASSRADSGRGKDWLAPPFTDTSLTGADVVGVYGKRWDIDVFFRTIKRFLSLKNGCQARAFDTLMRHGLSL
ncbi:hypothetical protein [Desulfolutivibrio sulfoxidireducens]|uniref:hypothetical protein n=1 Tax=Desulfolutivibrio sulfoxidireducens TaxID=2773299 RepID=UPI00159E6564|nr:hypothetical protein [Desulfolutivibrio sulfoxidireducens]QLA18188.1 hypothetical protein GD605_18660 [Desulfolutivibrio sulfoxidireducens]